MLASLFRASLFSAASRATILFFLLMVSDRAFAQRAPTSPDQPWHAPDERKIEEEAKGVRSTGFAIDPSKTYSLPELIDLAESHNPETRFAWERARAQAADLGIAKSDLKSFSGRVSFARPYKTLK
jgi:outer membrane protein